MRTLGRSEELNFFCKKLWVGMVLFYFCLNVSVSGQSYSITAYDNTWTNPASYTTANAVSATFSLNVLSTDEIIKKSQSGVTMILSLQGGDGNFAFDGSGTVTSTLADLTIDSYTIPAGGTTITVEFSTTADKTITPSFQFNGVGVYATGAGSGAITTIARTGGTGKIRSVAGGMHDDTNPTTAEPFGSFLVETDAVYVSGSSEVTQASTADVSQYTFNQEVLKVKINTTGQLNNTVTQLVFNPTGDDGTDDIADISGAKVYYNTTDDFATATLYGSATPGAVATDFTVTGSQALQHGDVYFYLVYDIDGGATATNTVDAQFVSFTMGGSTYTTISTPNPAGSRTVIAASKYYTLTGITDWDDKDGWETSVGGGDCNCHPSGGGIAYINHSFTHSAMGDGKADVIEVANGITLTASEKLTANTVIKTVGNGIVTSTDDIDAMMIEVSAGGTITTSADIEATGDVTVGAGGTLRSTQAAGGMAKFDLQGNIHVDGSIESTAMEVFINGATTQVISGSGQISSFAGIEMENSSKTIQTGADITFAGTDPSVSIIGAISIINNGTITTTGAINGDDVGSSFTNGITGTLNYGATTIMGTGVFNANAYGNTVNYTGGAMTLPQPSGSQYHHLTITNTGTMTQGADIYLSGNFTNNIASGSYDAGTTTMTLNGPGAQGIGGTAITSFYHLSVTNTVGAITFGNSFNIGADFTFNSVGGTLPGSSTIVFNGGAAQNIAGSEAPSFNNLTFANTAAEAVTLSTNINVAGNFVMTSPLAHGGQLVTFNGTSSVSADASPITFSAVTINGAGGATINTNTEIAGALTLTDGLLTPGTGTITILDGGSSSAGSASSYVNGALTKVGNSDFIFPVGAGGRYGPVTVSSIGGGSTTTELTGQYFDAGAPNSSSLATGIDHISRDEYWDVSNPTGDVTAADVTLSTTSVSGTAIISPAVPSDLLAVHYEGSQWENRGTGSTASVTSFSPFAYGSRVPQITLPVELADFDVVCQKKTKVFEWTTLTEINTSHFEIEASVEGISFESVALVEAAGVSNDKIDYSYECYLDCDLFQYFRLKQVDQDGSQYVYNTKSVLCEDGNGILEVKIQPNLVKTDFIVRLGEHQTPVTLEIIDAMGVVKQFHQLSANDQNVELNVSTLPRGVYFVRITPPDNKLVTKKIVKL